jgi:hypothetical protein
VGVEYQPFLLKIRDNYHQFILSEEQLWRLPGGGGGGGGGGGTGDSVDIDAMVEEVVTIPQEKNE